GDFQFGQLSGTGFGRSLALGSRFFQLGTTCFELGEVGRRSSGGFALGQQLVTTVARLDVYFVAQVAQARDFFEQDDFHLSLTSYLLTFTVRRPCTTVRGGTTAKIKQTVDNGH